MTSDETSRGRYRILRKLGAGGMGIVYTAHDPLLDCTVALKQLRPELGSSLIDRLRREARAMARLRAEPHVVTLYDFFADGEQVFVVMEYVEGATLRAFQDGPRAWRELLDKYLQAGAGLAAAHRAGLVHRDFKPKTRCPSQTAPLPPFGRILANRGDLRVAHRRVVPRRAAFLATVWQRAARLWAAVLDAEHRNKC